MSYTYNKEGQNVYFQRESDEFGHIYDPEDTGLTAFTIIPANYAHWRKLDYIPDTFDPVLPLIEKLKQFDVSDSKHASAIASGNIKPIEFTLNMDAQGMEFLALAIGAPTVSSHDRKFAVEITCVPDVATSLNNTYFFIDGVNAGGTIEHFMVWFDVDSGGSAPSCIGMGAGNILEVDISENDTAATIQAAVATKIAAEAEFADNTSAAAIVKIIAANEGATLPARDSGVAPTGFSFNQTIMGSTHYTITEDLTTDLPSFTIQLEQANPTSAESIVWDLFGCVVESVAVNVAFSDSIVKYSVTIKCPYALENSNGIATNPPAKKLIQSMSSMSALQESASNYIIQEGTTDRTPQAVEKVSLDIKNNIAWYPDIAKRYMTKACAGRRDITMNIVGLTQEKELFNYWQGAYVEDSGDYYPTGADRLNTVFKLQRDATYDYISIAIYSWLLNEHNFNFVNVDDAVKKVDMTFIDGVANSSGIMLTSNTFISLIDGAVMVEDALA